jgi:hypothetical protein
VRALAQAWPGARTAALPAALPDGSAYQPLMVLHDGTALVSSPTADRASTRLLLLARGTAVSLGTAPADAPGFTAVTADTGHVYWARTVPDAAGDARTSLWSATRTVGQVRQLVADAGLTVFNRSQYDLQASGGQLRWLTAVPGQAGLASRAVPIGGGAVTDTAVPAGYAPLAWPWFTNTGTATAASPALYDAGTGRRVPVRLPAGTVATCTTTWCQVQRPSPRGQASPAGSVPAGLDLVHPDGTGRQHVAGPGTATAVVDVALLDRFEILSVSAPAGATGTPPQQVLLFDARHRRTAQLAPAATTVQARDGAVWWSVGTSDTARWTWLDLTTLR